MRNYNREVVIKKLERRGCKIINGIINIPDRADLGIKMWGMVDFLKMAWTKEKRKGG
ncbi:MAG: hypothetical protein JW924_03130 [Fusobacteriaceae bacterium]|nr:hypothetical protein [Fusobacteriaceae bacterium]